MISIITILPLHLSVLAQSWRKYCLPMPPRAAEITPSHNDGPSQTDPENNTTLYMTYPIHLGKKGL